MGNTHVAGVRGSVAHPRKLQIIEEAKDRILDGDTLAAIAKDHGITSRTLNTWLSALGDEYLEIRQAWLDNMLAEAGEALESADDQFPLARARELFKRACWYAERRDRARYGVQPVAQAGGEVSVTINIGSASPVITIDANTSE